MQGKSPSRARRLGAVGTLVQCSEEWEVLTSLWPPPWDPGEALERHAMTSWES